MDALATSMSKHTVILITAGLGTFMGDYTKHPKQRIRSLSYKDKPVARHIIDLPCRHTFYYAQ